MRTTTRKTRLALLLLLLGLGAPTLARADYVLIGHAATVTGHLYRSEVKDVFTGKRRQWASDATVQVVLQGEGAPEIEWLAREFFGTSASLLLAKIKQQVFRGEMNRPIVVSSVEQALQRVRSNPGAVAIIPAAAARELPEGVFTIKVAN